DLELAIMLETYREAFVDKVQLLERLERDGLQRRLAISEVRYEEIVEKGEALVVTCERDGRILLFNRRAEELTGIPRDDAAEHTFQELFARPGTALSAVVLHAPYEAPARSGSGERWIRCHFTTLPSAIEPVLCGMGIDVTEERELGLRTRRAERLASLGTMAAGLAHEIRNPLNAAHLQLTLLMRRLGRT